MGCCVSSPYTSRRYIDPADLDEEIIFDNNNNNNNEKNNILPYRYFGTFRTGSNVIPPDDIIGLPSTIQQQQQEQQQNDINSTTNHHLASNPNIVLYEGEIDQGQAFNCLRPILCLLFIPPVWAWVLATGIGALLKLCNCDQSCCWVRKEYSTRRYFRVYSNRIEVNHPTVRLPWGYFGCGSWNTDEVVQHLFDRGSFGFRTSNVGFNNFCFIWPIYGGIVVRQRCPCNGSLWPRLLSDCNGCWCDEWICDICFCSYQYRGLANPEETAFACSIALQAYFEGRKITPNDMNKCIEYWKLNISEQTPHIDNDDYDDDDAVNNNNNNNKKNDDVVVAMNKESTRKRRRRRRPVCCEQYWFCRIPFPSLQYCYEYYTHPRRAIPINYKEEMKTQELQEVYDKYQNLRLKQIKYYKKYEGPIKRSTICRILGCRRIFGRKGLCFCTEDCNRNKCCSHVTGNPAPSFVNVNVNNGNNNNGDIDIDDENDASVVLLNVLGNPPANVVYRRVVAGGTQEQDEENNNNNNNNAAAEEEADLEMGGGGRGQILQSPSSEKLL